jgi:hypothetical protein
VRELPSDAGSETVRKMTRHPLSNFTGAIGSLPTWTTLEEVWDADL